MEVKKAENRIILNNASTMEVLKPVWNYDMVEDMRVKLRPTDNGRFISEILAEMINHDTTNI